MKNLLFIISLALMFNLLGGCASTHSSEKLVVGEITAEQLIAEYQSFSSNFNAVKVSEQQQQQVANWPSDLVIEVYFGTWCHDSQREVPRLLKLLEYNKNISVKLIALDYQKSDPQGLAQAKGVKYTPTIIVYRDNKEVGRVVERPKESLSADISKAMEL